MTDVAQPQAPAFATAYRRISSQLVPLLAVVTALVITFPFMFITGARGDIARGFEIVGTAYAALLEGATGLSIDASASPGDFNLVATLAEDTPLVAGDVGRLANRVEAVSEIGLDETLRYGALLERIGLTPASLEDEPEATFEEIDALGERIVDIRAVGTPTLDAMAPLIADLDEADRGEVRTLAEGYRSLPDELSEDARADIEALAPAASEYNDADLMAYMQIVDEQGIVSLTRMSEAVQTLSDQGIDIDSPDAADLMAIAEIGTENTLEDYEAALLMQSAGLTNAAELAFQLDLLDELYDTDLIAEEDVATAITSEVTTAVRENLIALRPNNQYLVVPQSGGAGVTINDQNTPDDTSDDQPETVYVRFGGRTLLFFPRNLEVMIVRSIPFVIAGLAVALGFKAGLFNIGAEGQLYAGAIIAVWIGYAAAFTGLPIILHLPLVIVSGIVGGLLWGAIPGALKAYTGAHEVITTIMLNFIAVRLVDWLIRTPGLMLDPASSVPRTPEIAASARIPGFDQPLWVFIAVGALYTLVTLYLKRDELAQNSRAALRPVLVGVLVALVGIFLSWITVRNSLHWGLLGMIFAVWLTDWFLNRTTLGFEMRTVGANQDAARYAGMSVGANLVLAMALSGALAGFAGMIEISGVQYVMQPAFFSGLGFDAIAVALLASTNPRNMIPAGFLWGGLLAGAPLMQTRAEISIDLVLIVQALIIMFIAADAIIRYLWRVPEATAEEKAAAMFSTGWGG